MGPSAVVNLTTVGALIGGTVPWPVWLSVFADPLVVGGRVLE